MQLVQSPPVAYDWKFEEIYRGVVITDGSAGLLLYAGCLQNAFYDENQQQLIKEGDIVAAYGKVSPYNGLFEVKPDMVKIVNTQAEKDKIAPVSYRTETITDLAKMKPSQTGDMLKVNGLQLYSTVSELNKLNTGEHWVIAVCDADENVINLGINYHVGEGQQEAIRNFLIEHKNDTFNFTGMLSATSNKIDLGPVMIGSKRPIEGFELVA